MAQQTAVEWFARQIDNETTPLEFWDAYKKAKAMEKEQIMQSYSDGVFDGGTSDEFYENTKESGEQYYNETYNK